MINRPCLTSAFRCGLSLNLQSCEVWHARLEYHFQQRNYQCLLKTIFQDWANHTSMTGLSSNITWVIDGYKSQRECLKDTLAIVAVLVHKNQVYFKLREIEQSETMTTISGTLAMSFQWWLWYDELRSNLQQLLVSWETVRYVLHQLSMGKQLGRFKRAISGDDTTTLPVTLHQKLW